MGIHDEREHGVNFEQIVESGASPQNLRDQAMALDTVAAIDFGRTEKNAPQPQDRILGGASTTLRSAARHIECQGIRIEDMETRLRERISTRYSHYVRGATGLPDYIKDLENQVQDAHHARTQIGNAKRVAEKVKAQLSKRTYGRQRVPRKALNELFRLLGVD